MCNVIIYMMIFHHLPSYKAPFWREHIPPGWSRDRPGCAASYYGWHPGGSIGEKLGNWSSLVVYEKSGMKLSLRRASFFFSEVQNVLFIRIVQRIVFDDLSYENGWYSTGRNIDFETVARTKEMDYLIWKIPDISSGYLSYLLHMM